MDNKEAIKKIIDDFFNNASEKDLLELQALLEKQERDKRRPGKMDVHNIANNFASDLRERMGLTSEKMAQSARDAVRTMILQYDPYIPEDQIRILVDKWVPDKENNWKKIPPDAMRSMISQFIAYGNGELTKEQLSNFPEGWAKKYWAFFPEKIQVLIKAYIKGGISKANFWESVEALLS